VIVFFRVCVLHPLGIVGRLVEAVPSALGVKRGDALLGELEVVRAIVISLLRLGVGPDGTAPGAGHFDQQVVERRLSHADADQVAGLAPEIDHIQIDVGQGAFERVERIHRIILRAQEPFLLRRDEQEQERPFRRRVDLR